MSSETTDTGGYANLQHVFTVQSNADMVYTIIKAFVKIAKSMESIMSTRISIQNRANLLETIIKGRHAYQQIFEAAARAGRSSGRASQSRTASPALSEAMSLVSLDSMAIQDEEGSQTEFEAADAMVSERNQKQSLTKYQKFAARPNVHQGLHLADIPAEYATAFNVCVFQGEDKHK
jgi:hypothetical protein